MALPIHHNPAGPHPRPLQPMPGGIGPGGMGPGALGPEGLGGTGPDWTGPGLLRARVHEFCGPSRTVLAAMVLGLSQGPVLWISPGWQAERLYPDGLAEFADPGRVIFARARRPEDVLWSAEEALRSGAVALVLADLADLPGLTPVRRLHLAAEAGATAAHHRGRLAPLGLLLTEGVGGASGVESRWHLAPSASGSGLLEQRAAWRLQRLRARMAPPAAWSLWRGSAGEVRAKAALGAEHA